MSIARDATLRCGGCRNKGTSEKVGLVFPPCYLIAIISMARAPPRSSPSAIAVDSAPLTGLSDNFARAISTQSGKRSRLKRESPRYTRGDGQFSCSRLTPNRIYTSNYTGLAYLKLLPRVAAEQGTNEVRAVAAVPAISTYPRRRSTSLPGAIAPGCNFGHRQTVRASSTTSAPHFTPHVLLMHTSEMHGIN